MSACTIYIRHDDPVTCMAGVTKRAQAAGLEVNPLTRQKPGDQFSRVILGTHNFVRSGKKGSEEARRAVLNFILQTTVLVGVPNASSPDQPYSVASVAAVADSVDAIVFDGFTVRDIAGRDMLE